jgi:hypothetical protein
LPPMVVGTPAVLRMWWIERGGRRLAVGAGDPTTLCGGSSGPARANSSMSPMISTPASARAGRSGGG